MEGLETARDRMEGELARAREANSTLEAENARLQERVENT